MSDDEYFDEDDYQADRDEAEHFANLEMEWLHDLAETEKMLAGGLI